MQVTTITKEVEVVRKEEVKETIFVLTEDEMAWVGSLIGTVSCGDHPIYKIYTEWYNHYNGNVLSVNDLYEAPRPVAKVKITGHEVIRKFLGKK